MTTGKSPIVSPPRFADTSRSRLQMAFIAGWLGVTFITVIAFRMPTDYAPHGDVNLNNIARYLFYYALAAGVSFFCCRAALRKVWSQSLGYLLIATATIVGVGIGVNLSGYCAMPGGWVNPDLGLWTDQQREWAKMTEYLNTGNTNLETNTGYIFLNAFLEKLTGQGIVASLLLNMIFTIGTVGASGYLSSVLLEGKNASRTTFYGALASASVASIIWYGTIFQKEAGVTFAFTLCGIALAKLLRRRFDSSAVVCGAIGGLLLMLLKGPMGWFVMAGTLIMCARYCRKNPPRNLRLYSYGIFMMLVSSAVIIGGREFRVLKNMDSLVGKNVTDNDTEWMVGYPSVERYAELIPAYFQSGPLHRVALLPLTATSQYFPPFPWNFTRDREEGRFVWYSHLSIFWYALAGAALGYIVLCMKRKRLRGGLGRWTLWWIVCYLGVAYFSGGTVARYYLPFVPCLVPVSLRFVQCVRAGLISAKSVKIYSAVYLVLLVGALISAYLFLQC